MSIQWLKNAFDENEKINELSVVFVFRKVNTVDLHNLGLSGKKNKKKQAVRTHLWHIFRTKIALQLLSVFFYHKRGKECLIHFYTL